MKIILIPILFFVLLAGCSQKEHQRWLDDGHYFPRPEADTFNFPAPVEQMPEREAPIVRIISGTEVEGVDDARRRLEAEQRAWPADLSQEVGQLTLSRVPLKQVAALLTELARYNITVTRDAAEVEVTIFLQNLPLRQALEAISRLNGLWYREDERIITLMTTEEYFAEMVIRRNEKSRAFWLRYVNANDMAKVIQAVLGAQVKFVDIGSEEVFGHVQEEKVGGEAITVEDLVLLDEEAKQKLMALGLLRDGQADALELAQKIEREVPAIITVFKRNNSIIARSLDENILIEIGQIIDMMDTPTSQVLLEINILQLSLDDKFESFFKVDFPGSRKVDFPDNLAPGDVGREITFSRFAAGTLDASVGLAADTLNVVFGSENIQARLELFASEGRVETLATPFLMSANNARVEFFVGAETPIREDVSSRVIFDDDGNPISVFFDVEISREEIGTDIEISSFINEDGTITMDFQADISTVIYNMTQINVINEIDGTVVPFPIDGIESSQITSILTAGSGQSLVIGGIIRERLEEFEKKVPLLGDIPIFGFFFREILNRKEKTETIIIITPHIIRHPALVWQEGRRFLDRRSSHPRFTRGQENILRYPTADSERAEQSSVELPQPIKEEGMPGK